MAPDDKGRGPAWKQRPGLDTEASSRTLPQRMSGGPGPPHKRGGPATGPPAILEPSTSGRRLARERVDAETRRLRVARWADREMPLAVWYRQPKGAFYCVVVEGWQPEGWTWAA